jgi:hypothetical protein
MRATFLNATVLGLIFLAFLGSGCTNLEVTSNVSGAQVLVDGVPIGATTPAQISLKRLGSGDHKISIQTADGMISPPQQVSIKVAPMRIVWSVLVPVPCLIINAIRGFNKPYPHKLQFLVGSYSRPYQESKPYQESRPPQESGPATPPPADPENLNQCPACGSKRTIIGDSNECLSCGNQWK